MRRFAAEGAATFLLVFLGTGACVADAVSGGFGAVGIGLIFGLAVYLGAALFGRASGAHMNPAVTLALWRAKKFRGPDVAPYILAQSAGALAASVALSALFRGRAGDLGMTHPSAGVFPSFALEFAMTFLLMLAILRSPGRWTAAAAAGVVALEAIFGGRYTGASMNPARSLAPALVAGRLDGLWIYLTAPVLGALSAVPSVRRGP